MKPTLHNIATDARCDVHQTMLGIREGKEGWFDLYCPGGIACDDDGELYSFMVSIVINMHLFLVFSQLLDWFFSCPNLSAVRTDVVGCSALWRTLHRLVRCNCIRIAADRRFVRMMFMPQWTGVEFDIWWLQENNCLSFRIIHEDVVIIALARCLMAKVIHVRHLLICCSAERSDAVLLSPEEILLEHRQNDRTLATSCTARKWNGDGREYSLLTLNGSIPRIPF